MKSDVFNQYVDRVSELYNVNKKDLFSKSKKREFVDARHLIYYLCSKRPIQISYIQKYMDDNGYKVGHSSVCHGIRSIQGKVDEDRDYKTIIKELDKAVFI
jgi:chromosomal replication initiation ATPase DnaA